jgi:hypothetical protein
MVVGDLDEMPGEEVYTIQKKLVRKSNSGEAHGGNADARGMIDSPHCNSCRVAT